MSSLRKPTALQIMKARFGTEKDQQELEWLLELNFHAVFTEFTAARIYLEAEDESVDLIVIEAWLDGNEFIQRLNGSQQKE